jgi:glycerophosphoryl diester phosphodiesterase
MDAELRPDLTILAAMRKLYLYMVFLILAGGSGCRKIVYFPDNVLDGAKGKRIAHRGGRNVQYRENTLDGIKAALRHMDGIEVDVQISKSQSIWLSHSADLMGCGKKLGCFPESTDAEIRVVTTCLGSDISYTNLEDVYAFMRDSFPDALICIDLKGWVPCSGNSLDIEGMMRKEAELIVALAEKYGLADNTIIETETASVLLYVRELNTNIRLYQSVFGDFERGMLLCLNNGFDGLSYKTNVGDVLDKAKMDLLHRKGLRLMAWNLRDQTEADDLKAMGVDYIQIDL